MKRIFQLLAIVLLLQACGSSKSTQAPIVSTVGFEVNLNDRTNDTFKVKVLAPTLTADNTIFQFASTAPGTYQVMDIGRYVSNFTAYNSKDELIETSQISTNQFQLDSPEQIAYITYDIAETWDTAVTENNIYLMCGTSIEEDHALINGQAVFGYFKGLQKNPISISLSHPEHWQIGTALSMDNSGNYLANSYDHVVDSPILLGRLTKASMNVQNTVVDIYTYSKTDKIESTQILESMSNMLKAASGFLNGLPVDRYTFLFHFEDRTNGAWEHSYSSEYVYQEKDWSALETDILEVASHEFFHVVTPLNIHSEIVQDFNFITPVPSKHLWLYEGTTEWAAHMMLLRSNQKSLDDYFHTLSRKIMIDSKYFDSDYSLVDLALTSYTKKGSKQYGNIYMRGALVAGLLDIKLLELSNGKIGLIDVVNDFATKYGPNKPFEDDTFFTEFVRATYPEIEDFMENYIKDSNPLPIKEYYSIIGVNYNEASGTFSLNEAATPEQLKLRNKWMQTIQLN
ncbi:MAG: hypothetical protein BM564_07360 [Bacteroidetes bacterium MedPE-SWsnd-G2]|nr:MAG: hypothetical protein BM564_07360 [Bacteroidetes bacterium MedPE-SWsnd-G2]